MGQNVHCNRLVALNEDGKVYKNCTNHSFDSDFIEQKHKDTIIRYYYEMMLNYAYTMYELKVY